jgi:hypothetical protein
MTAPTPAPEPPPGPPLAPPGPQPGPHPAPPYSAPPYPPSSYPASPPKKRNNLRLVLIIVGAVLVVCCGGAIGGGIWLFKNVQGAVAPAREAADGFIRDLEAGNYGGAYGRLCQQTKDRFSQAEFEQGVRGQPALTGHRIMGVSVNNVNGRQSGLVTAELTYTSGFVDRHTFPLSLENGSWKVCGQPY